MILTTLFWSSNIVVGKSLGAELAPISLAFIRWLLASILLLPIAIRFLYRDWVTIISHWKIILILSALGVSTFNTLMYTATHTTSATNIALIQTAMPLFVIILAWAFDATVVSRRTMLGLGVGIVGAVIVVMKGNVLGLGDTHFSSGDLIMVAGVFAYALYSVLMRRAPAIHQMSFLLITFVTGTLLLLPLFLLQPQQELQVLWQPEVTSAIFYLAIFPSILAYLFWNYGVASLGAPLSGLFYCFIPIFTSLIAVAFLNELLLWYHFVGMALMISSLIIVYQSREEDKKASQVGW